MGRLNTFAPIVLSIARLIIGLIFMEHGTQKLLGFPASDHAFGMFSLPWFAGIVELACGALIAVGFMTRPAAFLASGTMAVAYFVAHAPNSFFPVNNGGDAAILYCFFFLYLVFAGPGPISIDRILGHDPHPPKTRI
ncbi:MAG: DoxX family protein [Rhodobacteraceae bacterium]|nr:DoxX family protein [Paracoccaceae bacterium]MAY46694.1 DoxX family protein [Paracoccaceae bacterium]QEW21525.1 DoxX [Marinibacterium anthonyi]